MTNHLLLSIVLFGVMWLYLKIAARYYIIDQPTDRTSHKTPTIRGGGIIFPVAVIFWFLLYGFQYPYIITGMVLISFISFLDDVKGVRASIRIIVHLLAVALLFYEIGLLGFHWYWILFALILTIGSINAINFMDGINGITAFYSFITLGSFSLLNNAYNLLLPFFSMGLPAGWEPFFPGGLVGTLMASLLVFGFFNARRKAVVFAGDVGSIGMAFLMSWLLINLMVKSKEFYWILFFAVYGIDTSYTIFIRILRKENIFKPHRLHLYQLLANENGWPQLIVAALYAGIQLVLNLFVIYLVFTGKMNLIIFITILAVLLAVYIFARYLATRKLVVSEA
ncbi:MAG: UDP-GlcNAc--UDP-phosphate GlcNAc-1-phosphate transferase [Bacteroidales bacterium]|jgi:UDP-N-acetylmuramyl pentapeptide phosphotransferase/UDP-N-acetylglucosamine-1-phosphate transferase|nr:UDP-GlcNAc--UDP-phosphate GlcNAc-1-phosphate transferase [Bacteroidales bacterium]